MSVVSDWFLDNDNVVTIRKVQTSTMLASSSYLNSSTGMSFKLWKQNSTGSTANQIDILGSTAGVNVPYSTATTSGANGTYQLVVQTSGTSGLSTGLHLTGITTLAHTGGVDGQWREQYRVTRRGTT